MKRIVIAILGCYIACANAMKTDATMEIHYEMQWTNSCKIVQDLPFDLESELALLQDYSEDWSSDKVSLFDSCDFSSYTDDLFDDLTEIITDEYFSESTATVTTQSLSTLSNFTKESINSMIDRYFSQTKVISIDEAFHYAVYSGNIDLLKSLIHHDNQYMEAPNMPLNLTNVNKLGSFGLSPLDLAILRGNTAAAEILAKEGARVSYNNLQSVLDKPQLLKAILPYKFSLYNITNGTRILLEYPFGNFNEEVVSFLIDRGADVDIQDEYGDSFLTQFASYYEGDNEDFIEKVIGASTNLNAKDSLGNTALMNAWKNNCFIVGKLLKFKAC